MSGISSSTVVQALRNALVDTCSTFVSESYEVPPEHWNESVFRYYLVRSLLRRNKKIDCRTEWKRVDLMIPSKDGAVLVELKFFAKLATLDAQGNHLQWKGGPSRQNQREYESVVKKLAGPHDPEFIKDAGGLAGAYLVLAYSDFINPGRSATYGETYDNIEAYEVTGTEGPVEVSLVDTIAKRRPIAGGRVFTCKLLQI